MAFLYVTEYANVARELKKNIGQAPTEPALAAYRVAIGGGSATGPALNPKTRMVSLAPDAVCSYEIGPTATVAAVATAKRLAANILVMIGINDDLAATSGGISVAAITNT